MKKLFVFLVLLFWAIQAHANPITVEAFLSPDDVTISHLELLRSSCVNAINNADGNLLKYRTVSEDKLTLNADPVTRWAETFNNYVYTGLLPATSANLTSNTSAGTAYIKGYRVQKDATSKTYTPTIMTYVDLKSDGSYVYQEITPDVAPTIGAGTIRLAKVETDSDNIVAVTDLRCQSVTLENRQADFYRSEMQIVGSNTTFDEIRIAPGVTYWGNIRIAKTTYTNLKLDTAGDWVTGSAGANTWGYVVMNNAGAIKLSTTGPSVTDLAGNTDGTHFYASIGGNYYRVLGWFYMNGTNDINPWEWGNYQTDAPSIQKKHISSDYAFTEAAMTLVPDTRINFYIPARRKLDIRAMAKGWCETQHFGYMACLALDGTLLPETSMESGSTDNVAPSLSQGSVFLNYVTPELESGTHYVDLYVKQPDEYNAILDNTTIIVEVK